MTVEELIDGLVNLATKERISRKRIEKLINEYVSSIKPNEETNNRRGILIARPHNRKPTGAAIMTEAESSKADDLRK